VKLACALGAERGHRPSSKLIAALGVCFNLKIVPIFELFAAYTLEW
jgi:hypothetical protein